MSFDVTAFDSRTRAETGVTMPVTHPLRRAPFTNDAGEPITVTLKGRGSAAFEALQVELQRRAAEMDARGVKMNQLEVMNERAEIVTACTVGWTFDSMGGEPFPYTPENAARFWRDGRWRWLLNDAYLFLMQEGNFLAN